MSLDFYLSYPVETYGDDAVDEWGDKVTAYRVFRGNITHNLAPMAEAAGVYECLWHPEKLGKNVRAKDLVRRLRKGVQTLEASPQRFSEMNPKNGWGSYAGLLRFAREVLAACERYPNAGVETCT